MNNRSGSNTVETVFMKNDTNYSEYECIYEGIKIRLLTEADTLNRTYLWTPTSQTNSSITVNKIGRYKLRVIEQDGIFADTIIYTISLVNMKEGTLYIPNAFSPNGDGRNDIWAPRGIGVENYDLKIYDKDNGLIFKSVSLNYGWNGRINNRGDILPNSSLYMYYIKVKMVGEDKLRIYKGIIRLLA